MMKNSVISRTIITKNPAFLGASDTLVKNGFHNIQLVNSPNFTVFYIRNSLVIDNNFSIDSVSTVCTRMVIVEKHINKKSIIAITNTEAVSWCRHIVTSMRGFSSLYEFKKFVRNNSDKVCFLFIDTRLRYEEASKVFSEDSPRIYVRIAMVEREAYLP